MADFSKEPWMDPGSNALYDVMEGNNVKVVMIVGADGQIKDPEAGGGGGGGPVNGATSTVTSVPASIVSVQLLAAEANRIEAIIRNDSVSESLYVKYGSAASSTSHTVELIPGDSLVVDKYTGIIHGIWTSATGDARITQVTP